MMLVVTRCVSMSKEPVGHIRVRNRDGLSFRLTFPPAWPSLRPPPLGELRFGDLVVFQRRLRQTSATCLCFRGLASLFANKTGEGGAVADVILACSCVWSLAPGKTSRAATQHGNPKSYPRADPGLGQHPQRKRCFLVWVTFYLYLPYNNTQGHLHPRLELPHHTSSS